MQFFEPSAPAQRHETGNGHLDRRDRTAGGLSQRPGGQAGQTKIPNVALTI
jgi:hypothetical protein